jgi:hypothetical protein
VATLLKLISATRNNLKHNDSNNKKKRSSSPMNNHKEKLLRGVTNIVGLRNRLKTLHLVGNIVQQKIVGYTKYMLLNSSK